MLRRDTLKTACRRLVSLVLNPRFLLCFGVAWIVTNGWSYILFAVGTWLGIGWMVAVSVAYMTFLWMPFTPEKLLTLTIAILLLRWLFPKDEKTLGTLRDMIGAIKAANQKRKARRSLPGQAQKE